MSLSFFLFSVHTYFSNVRPSRLRRSFFLPLELGFHPQSSSDLVTERSTIPPSSLTTSVILSHWVFSFFSTHSAVARSSFLRLQDNLSYPFFSSPLITTSLSFWSLFPSHTYDLGLIPISYCLKNSYHKFSSILHASICLNLHF